MNNYREEYYNNINNFVEENSYDRSSGAAYFAYLVALCRECRDALHSAMKYMYETDPSDVRIPAAVAIDAVLRKADVLWEDYEMGAPIQATPLIFTDGTDIANSAVNILSYHVASFPESSRLGGYYGGNEPADWVKEIIDSRGVLGKE